MNKGGQPPSFYFCLQQSVFFKIDQAYLRDAIFHRAVEQYLGAGTVKGWMQMIGTVLGGAGFCKENAV